MRARRAGGATLVELVIAIVVISTALAGAMTVIDLTTAKSADPVISIQAQAIARAYLEEILLRAYGDPDGVEAGENRANFDDVDDYHLLADNGCLATSAACPSVGDCACDQTGAPIEALAGYNVAVAVVATTLNSAIAQRVDVTVTHDRFPDLSIGMSGYRTSY